MADDEDRPVGDPDGHGRWACLDASADGETVLCHECGAWVVGLGSHAYHAHQITAADYRARHGLMVGKSLISPASRERMRARPQLAPGGPSQVALERHRDPARARAGMTAEGQLRPQRRAIRADTGARARRGRDLTAAELDSLDRSGRDLASWAREARRLVEDGVRQAEIARVTGLSETTVNQRLRRLAPPEA